MLTSRAAREALDHFLATAAIGLALSALGEVLPLAAAQQPHLPAGSSSYAILALLTAFGSGLYNLLKSNQGAIAADLAQALDKAAPAGDKQA